MSDHCNLKSVTDFSIQHLVSLGISMVCLYISWVQRLHKVEINIFYWWRWSKKGFLINKVLYLICANIYVQCFKFKILNDILFTNSRLAKIGLIQSDLCSFWNTCPETIDHLFFYCVYSRAFWEEFESYWIAIAKEQRKLELKKILIGVTNTKCPLFNYVIVLGKLHLWSCRRNSSLPSFSSYKN